MEINNIDEFIMNDDFVMMPLENIKVSPESDEEIEQVIEGAFVTNTATDDSEDGGSVRPTTVLLQENINLKSNIDVTVVSEDPLDILSKFEMKIEVCEEFVGEYNEKDLLYQEENDQKVEVKEALVPQAINKSKRMRSSLNPDEIRGRNGFVWSTKNTENTTGDTTQHKSMQPKGKGPARIVSNMLEAWQLLVDEPILLSIVKYTNEEIKRRKRDDEQSKQPTFRRNTDMVELRAWMGLNYLCGIFRAKPIAGGSASTLEELWTPELGNSIFRATMTLKRFEFLSDCLNLAEHSGGKKALKRDLRQSDYALNAVRAIWDKFIINCRSYYAPSVNCTLQEHIIDVVDTNCPLQQTLPDVKERTGIRLIGLHDAKSLYMCNSVLALTEQPTRDELFALVCDIKGTQRNITLSQRYTSLEIAKLLQQCELSLVGALDPQSKELPPDYANISINTTSKQKVKSATPLRQLYANNITLIAQQAEPTLLLSAGVFHKIDTAKLYAVTYNAGQRFHDNAACYSTTAAVAATNTYYRWPLRVFHALLDIASLNASLLFRLSEWGNAGVQHRDFQRQLGLFLTQQHLKRRLQRNVKIPLQLKLLISEILGEPPEKLLSEAVSSAAQASSAGVLLLQKAVIPGHVELLPRHTVKRNRCRQCPSKQNSKTRWQCQQCAKSLCVSHLILRCETCSGVIAAQKTQNKEQAAEQDDYFK